MKKICMATLLLMPVCTLSQDQIIDKIVAVVDEKIILRSELDSYALSLAMRSKIDPTREADKYNKIRSQTLEQMIIQKVLWVKAKEDSVEVDEAHVKDALDNQINGMIQQVGSKENLEKHFGSSMRRIRSNFKKDIEERLLVETLQKKRVLTIPVSKREVTAFYKSHQDSLPPKPASVNISHILVSVKASDAARNRAFEKLEEARKEIEGGMDFGDAAKKFSEGPTGPLGGDLGMIKKSDLAEEYSKTAAELEVGEISGIVETQFGLHLIKLLGKKEESIHTQHILIQIEKTKEDEKGTIAFLDSLGTEITQKNISFEDAAGKYSEDQTTKDNAGDLGWFNINEIQLPAWRDAAQALRVGEISAPLKTEFGYIIVKLDEKTAPRPLDIEKDWDEVYAFALNQKREKEFLSWVEELKKDVYIRINQ